MIAPEQPSRRTDYGMGRVRPPAGLSARVFPLLVALLFSPVRPAPAAEVTAPARNWALPIFTKEGFHSVTARGSEARALDNRTFEVVDLNLTFFAENAANTVETVILSPAATFIPDQKIARGEKYVRFIRDDIEATGIRWVYHHADKKISLDGNVRVTFHSEIKDLLR